MVLSIGHSTVKTKLKLRAALIYQDTPRYDFWLKAILGGVLLLTFVLGIVLLYEDPIGAWVMFGATVFDALLFKAILPRRFEIFEDRIRIALGGPFALNIPLAHIKEARAGTGRQTMFYSGIRFATSSHSVVEIRRSKGMNLVISPGNRDRFLEETAKALEAARQKIK
ncbi:MAG: PH domain-containing protein [Chloroflexi bacterium]|nr:PH domain-containing protein [Chloroflexota bacterium]